MIRLPRVLFFLPSTSPSFVSIPTNRHNFLQRNHSSTRLGLVPILALHPVLPTRTRCNYIPCDHFLLKQMTKCATSSSNIFAQFLHTLILLLRDHHHPIRHQFCRQLKHNRHIAMYLDHIHQYLRIQHTVFNSIIPHVLPPLIPVLIA
ncbi:unnamed protein product [Albugo candida]|uniref:Uncharacterized protein n=1 Tax=Albugo candida TaxID=65357 RepID=A0A024GJ87_9STRA|nr:unnamed protein product [Albugo candida]|eukprot:CCI46587.1 unnamed protein product [Albugo candida]